MATPQPIVTGRLEIELLNHLTVVCCSSVEEEEGEKGEEEGEEESEEESESSVYYRVTGHRARTATCCRSSVHCG